MEVKEHEIYTAEETLSLLKISKSTFLRLVKRGIISACKVGGQYRVLGREVLELFGPQIRERAKIASRKMLNKLKGPFENIKP